MNASTRVPEGVPAKATLFCPCCAFRNPVDGDWVVVESSRASRYVCPSCEATVTRRPWSFDDDGCEGDGPGPMTAWARRVRAWGRAMTTWQRAPHEAVGVA